MYSINESVNDNKLLFCIIIIIIIVCSLYYLFINSNQNNAVNQELFCQIRQEQGKKYKIILYYTDWCGYSRMFLPEWSKFEQYVYDNINNLMIEKIDCQNKQFKDVNGYPTVIIYDDFGNKKVMETHPRTLNGLINFTKEFMNQY